MNMDLSPECSGVTVAQEQHMCIVCDLLLNGFASRNFEEKKHIIKVGRPTPNISITTAAKTCVRKFNNKLFETNEWLTGCSKKQKLFCWCCLLFSKEKSVWSSGGYSDVGNVHNAIKKHSSTQNHLQAILNEKTFGKARIEYLIDSQKKVRDTQHNELVRRNREIMKRLIDITCYLGKQELAFRGHDESAVSCNRGNYVELVMLLCRYDEMLRTFIENGTVFTGLSNIIQNDLIESVSNVLMTQIRKEITETKFIALSLDETADVANYAQLSVIMRYVTVEGEIHDRFIRFVNISGNRTADALYNIVNDLLKEYNCGGKLVAQSYDGAAVMAGHLNGLQAKVKHTFPQALFVHCFAHRLNLVLSQAVSQIRECRIFFLTVNGIAAFFSKSTKRTQALDDEIKKRLPRVSQTRWNYNSRVVERIHEQKKELIDLFKIISSPDEKWDEEAYKAASGFVNTMEDFNFSFLLEVFACIFPLTDTLYNILQAKSSDIGFCVNKIREFQRVLQNKREAFEEFWNKICEVQEPPTKRQKGTDSLDRKTHYKRLYCEVFDVILLQLRDRFSNLESLHFLELLNEKNFNKFTTHFPEIALQSLKDTYPSVFDFSALKSQLIVTYMSEDMHHKSVNELLNFVKSNELEKAYSEVTKLCELILTIPASSASVERSFSKLKNIKNYARNTQGQERLSNLSLIALERELLTSLQEHQQFYDGVIEDFIKVERRIQLQFK